MSAAEVIEQIKKLSPEDHRTIRSFMDDLMESVGEDAERTAHVLNDALVSPAPVKYIPRDVFETAKKRVFEENRELLARLAK